MSLDLLELSLVDYLKPRTTPTLTRIGGEEPRIDADLPAIALSFRDTVFNGTGFGKNAEGEVRGALLVESDVDLADPEISIDGETIPLLSPDRKEFQVPLGPLVAADGDRPPQLGSADISITVGGQPFTLVTTTPQAQEYRADPVESKLFFGSALPATGILGLQYHIGTWEVETICLQGLVDFALYGTSAAQVTEMTTSVLTHLRAGQAAGLRKALPVSMSTIVRPTVPGGENRFRVLSVQVDFQHSAPRILTGGGLIRRIEVQHIFAAGDGEEAFVVQ